MIADLADLLTAAQVMLWVGFAAFVRASAMMALLPGFGDQVVPMRVRLGLAVAFSLVVAPTIEEQVETQPTSLLEMFMLLGPEVVTGLFLGLFLRFFILALQIAGSIAAQSTSLSQIFGGSAGVDPQPAIGHLLVVAGTALAAMMGLHIQIAAYIIHSYTMVPFGVLVAPGTVITVGTEQVSRTFALGFTLAAPFVVASLIYNVVLGVINRAMPQLMVSFVGAPAITAGGIILMLIAGPMMLAIWHAAFSSFVGNPFGSNP